MKNNRNLNSTPSLFNKRWIYQFLICFFIDIHIHPDSTPMAEPFSKESLTENLKTEILQILQHDQFKVTVESWQSSWERQEDYPIKILDLTWVDKNKRFRATVEYGNQKRIIMGSVIKRIKLPVVEHAIASQDSIDPTLITFQEFDESSVPNDVILDINSIKGLKVRSGRILKPNTPIRQSDLEKPILIKRGDQVQVHFVDPTLDVSTIAYAKNDGTAGDTISFEVESKKIIQATVIAEGRAEIKGLL